MRRSVFRSFSAVALLALVAGGTSGAVAASSPAVSAAADPCMTASLKAEPAACAAAAPADPAAVGGDVAIAPGDAFADGLSTVGGGTQAKLAFPAGDMSSPGTVDADAASIAIYGYDFSVDTSTLYALNSVDNTLNTVNQTTGALTPVGPMTLPAGESWTDIMVDPASGAAYATSGSAGAYTLSSLNLATGATTIIQTVTTTAFPVDFSINCAGDMYAETLGDDSLYHVNRTTGALTAIGPMGVDINFAQGMDFDNATGTLYAYLYLGGGSHQYSSLNLTTGAATQAGASDPNGEFEGAVKTTCPAPAAPTAAVTTGPTGHTADLRPTFGFFTTNATTVQCSVDKGTAVFVACPGATYRPAANLTPGAYTFRVKATTGAQTANATRAFTVVDCATLKANVSKASHQLKKAKKKLKKAKKTANSKKIKKAKKKVKKANKAKKAAQAALAAEPVCV